MGMRVAADATSLASRGFIHHNSDMEVQSEHILQTALSLPVSDRAEIAASLIESLDDKVDADVDAAWAEEIKRRIDSIDNGQVQLIPWDEMIRSMRDRLHG